MYFQCVFEIIVSLGIHTNMFILIFLFQCLPLDFSMSCQKDFRLIKQFSNDWGRNESDHSRGEFKS